FQAEDGIRDYKVTGVQTCALPIYPAAGPFANRARKIAPWTTLDLLLNYTFNLPAPPVAEVPGYAKDGGKNVKMKDGKEKNVLPRSEERRVGKEWRSRGCTRREEKE